MSLMADEIAQQPEAIERTLAALLPLRPEIARLAKDRTQVLLVARGTSDNAAVYGRYLLETHVGRSAGLAAPSVATHYRRDRDLSDALVVSLSQSGATAEIVETQAWARRCGAATLAITNEADSPLATESDLALVTQAGPERAVPATKTYMAQLVAMGVLASALSDDPSRLEGELSRAADQARRLLEVPVDEFVERLAVADEVVATGRGLCLGTALEVALKLEETCLRPVRGLSYADLRHGPLAIIDSEVAVVVVSAGDGPLLSGLTELAEQLGERGATVLGIGGDDAFTQHCALTLPGPDLTEAVAPLGLIVPAQLAIEALATRLGLDPDSPRGLSKVTQTDQPHQGGGL